MKKIKIIRSRPIKEEEEVIDQVPQNTAPETPEITYESNPLEFMLMKYPTLTKTLTDLLTDDFRNYITGVYIMAPKPTIFKIVLHNNRSFYLIFMGDDKYEAKVSGKKYWLASIGELERATISIAELLMLGTPPSTEGPETEMTATPEEEAPTEEEGGEEAATATPEPPEELAEGKLGVRIVKELAKKSYDILSDESKIVAQNLIKTIGISQNDIQPSSSNTIVVYNDNREKLVNKTAVSKKFGPVKDTRKGNFKVGNTTIIFKPLKTSGEYYKLKPQDLGVTTNEYISLDILKKELIDGVKKSDVLSDIQKKFIIALVTKKDNLTSTEKEEIKNDSGFIKELLKNLGEPLGAIEYANQIGATEVLFPKAGNYPLVDYLLNTPKGEIQVSAKTAKGQGNIVKPEDLLKLIDNRKGKIDPKKRKILTTISDNDVKTGALKLIPEFGDDMLNKKYQTFLKKHPNFPKGQYDASTRIYLEKEIIKQLNRQVQFDEEFDKYVTVHYVKYNVDPETITPTIKVIKDQGFNVELRTKNSPGHDSDKIGFSVNTFNK